MPGQDADISTAADVLYGRLDPGPTPEGAIARIAFKVFTVFDQMSLLNRRILQEQIKTQLQEQKLTLPAGASVEDLIDHARSEGWLYEDESASFNRIIIDIPAAS